MPNGTVRLISNVGLSYDEVVAKLRAKITDKPTDIASGVASVSYSGIPAGGIPYGGKTRDNVVTITATDNAGNVTTHNNITVRVTDK